MQVAYRLIGVHEEYDGTKISIVDIIHVEWHEQPNKVYYSISHWGLQEV